MFGVPSLEVLLWITELSTVRSDWGDNADASFHCPALTTCEAVCVSNISRKIETVGVARYNNYY